MSLQTFLDDGCQLLWVQYATPSSLLTVTINRVESPSINQGTFTVRPIIAQEEGSAASSSEQPVPIVGATYLSPLITTTTGDVFNAALYEMA